MTVCWSFAVCWVYGDSVYIVNFSASKKDQSRIWLHERKFLWLTKWSIDSLTRHYGFNVSVINYLSYSRVSDSQTFFLIWHTISFSFTTKGAGFQWRVNPRVYCTSLLGIFKMWKWCVKACWGLQQTVFSVNGKRARGHFDSAVGNCTENKLDSFAVEVKDMFLVCCEISHIIKQKEIAVFISHYHTCETLNSKQNKGTFLEADFGTIPILLCLITVSPSFSRIDSH